MRDPVQIIQISDCHLFSNPATTGPEGINPFQTLAAVLKKIQQLKPDMVLLTGDISGDDSEESYQHFMQLWQQYCSGMSLVSIPGNHDVISFWETHFSAQHRVQHVHIQDSPWYLHCLPSNFVGTRALISEDNVARVCDFISAHSNQYHMVVLHHPVQEEGVWMDKHSLINPDVLTPLYSLSALKIVLHGHVHTPRTVNREHVKVLACPSTCWQWGNTPEFSVAKEAPALRVIHLSDDGGWETQIVSVQS
ncbi:metallophosphoesterase family protein [Alteromonas facilis]|uniref:metallophosphoesterase family protein n=1 Tax=Alteromonas facilis TaxID=2048004 RepID=UPI0013D989A1|nr:metallophosphoesterase [Alteromonas facilis]